MTTCGKLFEEGLESYRCTEAEPCRSCLAAEVERLREASGWSTFASAPKGGGAFLALNCDGEIWVCHFDRYERLAYRTNKLNRPRRFQVHRIDGKELLEEDKSHAEKNEKWQSAWSFWSRGYTFNPTHWASIPSLPVLAL